MSMNSLKKNLVFSSMEVKEFVDKMVSDESLASRRKPSAILEPLILNGLTTTNSQVSFWIQCLYSDWTIGEVLESIFSYNANGVNWKSNNLPLLPFIEFAIYEQKFIKVNSLKDERIHHLTDTLDSILRIFKDLKENNLDMESQSKYRNAIGVLEYLIEALKNEDYEGQFMSLFRFFKEYWNDCSDSTHTFRALADIAHIQKGWRNTPESRYELTVLLRDLATRWPKELER